MYQIVIKFSMKWSELKRQSTHVSLTITFISIIDSNLPIKKSTDYEIIVKTEIIWVQCQSE